MFIFMQGNQLIFSLSTSSFHFFIFSFNHRGWIPGKRKEFSLKDYQATEEGLASLATVRETSCKLLIIPAIHYITG